MQSFIAKCKILIKKVLNNQRFIMVELYSYRLIKLEERPGMLKSNYTVMSIYVYNDEVFN